VKSKLIIVVLFVIIAGLLYKFVIAGDTRPVPNERIAIELSPAERAQQLAQMRDYELAVQEIVQGLVKDDKRQIEGAAIPVGSKAMKRIHITTMAKLPYKYKQATIGMHRDFDRIAIMAHQGKDAKTIQLKLADSMNRCISCHSSYKLPAHPPAK